MNENQEILNKLDYIKEKLHDERIEREDTVWLINTINSLLVKNYLTDTYEK